MTMKEDVTLSETYQLSILAPQNTQVLMQSLDFLFLRYLREVGGDSKLITKYIQEKGGYTRFLQEIYGNTYDWNSIEPFTITTLGKFLESISEIGDRLYNHFVTPADRTIFRLQGGDSEIGFAGKKYFQDEGIKTNDIVVLEGFLRYHLVQKWIQMSESYKKEVDEMLLRNIFSNKLQSIISCILVPHIAFYNNAEASRLLQRLLFLISKSQELPIFSVIECNTKLESLLKVLLLGENMNNSADKQLLNLVHQVHDCIVTECGTYGTIEFAEFRVQTVLLGEKDSQDPNKCLIKVLPLENFYFRKDEEIVSEKKEIFPIQGNLIHNRSSIVGRRNCNIFDPQGNKVFWGDMSQSDIEKIQGTHYILTQYEGWQDVPDFLRGNIQSLKPTKDQFSPGYMNDPTTGNPVTIRNDVQWVHPDYVRMMAVAKIENGKYIENLRKVEL